MAFSLPQLKHTDESTYAKSYRVRGIPRKYNRGSTEELLRLALDLDRTVELKVYSLGPSPYEHKEKVATFAFRGESEILSGAKNEWAIHLHDTCVDGSMENKTIIVDSHFEGFTPLNDVGDDHGNGIE